MSSLAGKFRIVLYALDTSTGWRGSVSASIYDPIEVGVSEKANDVGEAYWVLPNNHPLISECKPLLVHYEIWRFDEGISDYKWIGAGILNDAEVGQNETTFRGLDYMAVFNQYYTPTVALTFNSTSYISADVSQSTLSTIFGFSPGTLLTNSSETDDDPATPGKGAWYTNSNKLIIDNVVTSARVSDTLTIDSVTITTSSVELIWDAVWSGTTLTNFPTTKSWRFRIDATPPASESPQVPTNSGGVFEIDFTGNSTVAINNCVVKLYPYESKEIMYQALINAGRTSASATTTMAANAKYFALRKGVTYGFVIHGAIYRTASSKSVFSIAGGTATVPAPHWVRTNNPPKTDKFTLGTGYENFTQIFDRVFNAAKSTFPKSRIRYASRTISGSPSTTMLTFSAGEDPVTYLANTARLEMAARSDSAKVIFGISHPASTASYDGNFRIRYNVSSVPIPDLVLSFPENIRGYSYTPGAKDIVTHVRVIPSTPFLAGTASAGAVGVSINGATATTGEATTYGEIPKLITQAGFVDEFAAQLEALRLASSGTSTNTAGVSITLNEEALKPWDGWDLGDSVNVHIVHGNVNIPSQSLNIAGMEWVGASDGHEELTLELIQGTNF